MEIIRCLLFLTFNWNLAAGQCGPGFALLNCDTRERNGSCCQDIFQCAWDKSVCESRQDVCITLEGSVRCSCPSGFKYYCMCRPGHPFEIKFRFRSAVGICMDINECVKDRLICGEKGICQNMNGTYQCQCPSNFTNFGHKQGRCVQVPDCDLYESQSTVGEKLSPLDSLFSRIRQNCLMLGDSRNAEGNLTGKVLLQELVNATDSLQVDLQSKAPNAAEVTKLLSSVENALRLIAPQLKQPLTRIETNHAEAELVVRRDKAPPTGPVSLTNENAKLDTTWDAAVGNTYPGFAFAILLSYKSLKPLDKNSTDQLSSNMVTVSVSNPNTTHLPQPANLTFTHLEPDDEANQTCVHWSEEKGEWSERGCRSAVSNSTHTVCSCNHLSSFALLKSVHNKDPGQLSSVMWVGVAIAAACVVASLLVTLWCRSNSRKHNVRRRKQQDDMSLSSRP